MASREELEAALTSSQGRAWESARDLNRISLEALLAAGDGARTLRSSGSLRLHGVNIVSHSARLDSTADVLAQLQRLVTAMGAAKRGIKNSQGPLPSDLVTLTQLKIAAAPTAGSLIFDLVPESLPETELLDNGNVAIFDQSHRQFVDECFEEAISLVFAAHSIGPDADAPPPVEAAVEERPRELAIIRYTDEESSNVILGVEHDGELEGPIEYAAPLFVRPANDRVLTDALVDSELDRSDAVSFVERVRVGGPRLASAVRTFAKAVESAEFDVDLEWREPNRATLRAQFTRHDASLVRRLVVSRELDTEARTIVGRLITLSTTKAWQLVVEGDAIVTVDATKLTKAVRSAFHLEQQVSISARAIEHQLPGGGSHTTFEAVTVMPVGDA